MRKNSRDGTVGAKDINKIGLATCGSYWKVDIAAVTRKSKSQLTRYLNEQRTPDMAFGQLLKGFMIQRVDEVGKLFTTTNLPDFDSKDTVKAQKLIAEAVLLLQKGSAVMPNYKPTPPYGRGGGLDIAKAAKKAKKAKRVAAG